MSSPNFPENDEIIDPIDAEMLQQKGLAGPIISGRREISKSLLSSDAYVDASTYDSGPGDKTFEIPVFLESLRALEYFGFLEWKAKKLWHNWNKLTPDGRVEDFVYFAQGPASRYSNDVSNNHDEDWIRHMDEMGINPQTIDAIMHPKYKEIRLCNSCNYWVRDTIRGRYEALVLLERTSFARGERLKKEHNDGAGENEAGESGARGSQQSLPEEDAQGVMKVTGRGGKPSQESSVHSPNAVVQQALPTTAPGKTTLWKAISEAYARRLKIAWDEGEVELDALMSPGPTDFNAIRPKLCLAVHRRTAELHADYAKHRSQGLAMIIVRMDIPNRILEDMETVLLPYGTTGGNLCSTAVVMKDPAWPSVYIPFAERIS